MIKEDTKPVLYTKYWTSTEYLHVLGTILGTKDTLLKKWEDSCCHRAYILVGMTDNNHVS